jgi:hypothetical protein
MQLPEAITLVDRLVETGEKHKDYERVIELAETYRIYITGMDIHKKLIQFVQREEESLFKQRCQLTKSITPAVASSIRKPFNKVVRNNRIRKDIKIKTEGRKQIVDEMIKNFYGSARKKNRGLEYWLKTRFVELQFIDPNAWIVVEWDTPENASAVVKPRPFEVSAKEAVHFFAVNDEVRWLLVKQDITFSGYHAPANPSGMSGQIQGVVQPATEPAKKHEGSRYTLYDEDVTVVYEQVDPEFLKSQGYVLKEGEQLKVIKDITYLIRNYTPNVGYPPVVRIGYFRDEATKGRTFVNPWHDALCYFDKTLKTVSELDLTMCLHTFPQKIQYVQKCPGPDSSKRCKGGRLADNSVCPNCKGSGYKLHTTAQDAILLPMPEGKDDMLDLEGLLVYKAPPIDLIKFQNEYTQQLERQAHQAVYNSQVFVKKSGGPSGNGSGQPIQTATEADFNMESVYDALEPFTEKYSETWRDFIITFAILAGAKVEDVEAVHEFPADYKLKTGQILLAERKTASESGAPGFLIEAIDDDLATITYTGDQLGMLKYVVKRRFFPFTGTTPDEIATLLSSKYVPDEPKVLYCNFDQIFKEIEAEKPDFWMMKDPKAQRELVEAKVKKYMDKLAEQQPKITVDTFREGNPDAGNNGGGGDGNPGNENNDDDANNKEQ